MSWSEEVRDMLERAEGLAHQGDDRASAGFVSRFIKAALDPPETMNAGEVATLTRALKIIQEPPFYQHRRVPLGLLALLERETPPNIGVVLTALVRIWAKRTLSEAERDKALMLSKRTELPGSLRAHFAVLSGDLDALSKALFESEEIDLDHAELIHHFLLEHTLIDPSEENLELLTMMYERTTWLGRRILLSQLRGEEHAPVLPALVSLGKASDPSTRRAVIQALGRIGHVAAEPYLLAMFESVEPGVRGELVDALGALGTRLSIETLRGEIPGPWEEKAGAAVERIEARHPILNNMSGGLTLAGDGARGALSLSGVGDGEISLYERVESEVASVGEMIRVEQTAIAPKHLAWHRLVAGPRDVPWLTWVDLHVWGRGRAFGYWTLMATSLAIGFTALIPHMLILVGIATFGLRGELRHARRQLKLLREGTPTFAELHHYQTIEVETGGYNNGKPQTRTEHVYEFEYMDERGERHTKMLQFVRDMPELSDDPLERVLYNDDGDIVLFDELKNMDVREDGSLMLPPTRTFGLGVALVSGVVLWLMPVVLALYVFFHVYLGL